MHLCRWLNQSLINWDPVKLLVTCLFWKKMRGGNYLSLREYKVLFFCRCDDFVHSPGEGATVSQCLLYVVFVVVLTAF